MLYHFVIFLLSAKKLNHVRVSIDHRLVHYILANPKAKMTINNNSQFTSLVLHKLNGYSKISIIHRVFIKGDLRNPKEPQIAFRNPKEQLQETPWSPKEPKGNPGNPKEPRGALKSP